MTLKYTINKVYVVSILTKFFVCLSYQLPRGVLNPSCQYEFICLFSSLLLLGTYNYDGYSFLMGRSYHCELFLLFTEMLCAFLNQGKRLILLHVKLWYLWQGFKAWVVIPNTYVTLKVFPKSFPTDKDSFSLFQTFPTLATVDGIPAIIYLILRTIIS